MLPAYIVFIEVMVVWYDDEIEETYCESLLPPNIFWQFIGVAVPTIVFAESLIR